MAIYKTYREAVIENGSTKDIYCAMISKNGTAPIFGTKSEILKATSNIIPCNPADHLESLESFFASGKELVKGDSYVELNGSVQYVEYPEPANIPNPDDSKRFILQAAADKVETPEEKEAFEVMTSRLDVFTNDKHSYIDITPEEKEAFDTTPQQVESLSGSEKPNKSEWDGEGLPPVGEICEFKEESASPHVDYKEWSECLILAYNKAQYPPDELQIIIRDVNGDAAIIYSCDNPLFRKPETPEERKHRERLESAYDLYCKCGRQHETVSFEKFKVGAYPEVWLDIVDKTGYRKEKTNDA